MLAPICWGVGVKLMAHVEGGETGAHLSFHRGSEVSGFEAGFEIGIVRGNWTALCVMIVEHVVQGATTVIILTQVNDTGNNKICTWGRSFWYPLLSLWSVWAAHYDFSRRARCWPHWVPCRFLIYRCTVTAKSQSGRMTSRPRSTKSSSPTINHNLHCASSWMILLSIAMIGFPPWLW